MKSNLKFRLLTIVVVILVCVYGIIGLPNAGTVALNVRTQSRSDEEQISLAVRCELVRRSASGRGLAEA